MAVGFVWRSQSGSPGRDSRGWGGREGRGERGVGRKRERGRRKERQIGECGGGTVANERQGMEMKAEERIGGKHIVWEARQVVDVL